MQKVPLYDYFKKIEHRYKNNLSTHKAIVIRLDGKDITKNTTINLQDHQNLFTRSVVNAIVILQKKIQCKIYIALDEINFIFEDPNVLLNYYNKTGLQDCLALFIQDFTEILWEKYSGLKFSASMFCIYKDKIDLYIKYRQSLCFNTAIFYYAKRNLNKENYKNKKLSEVLEFLEENGHMNNLKDNKFFLYGKVI